MRNAAAVGLALLLARAAAAQSPADLPVTSHEALDPAEFNERIAVAVRSGEPWTTDPLLVCLELLKPIGGRFVSIVKEDEWREVPRKTTVTIRQDGFLDDSVSGVWNQLDLTRGEDGRWRVEAVRRAYRCQRVLQTESFGSEICP